MRCSSFAGSRALRACAGLRSFMPAVMQAIGVGLIVAGCASSQAAYDSRSNVGAGAAQRVAMAVPKKVEIEDDGLAVQAPPVVRKRLEPDDPSEPFSPNYGPGPVEQEPVKAPARPQVRADAGPVILRSRVTPMSSEEAARIIARAMVAHEVRNP